jgi:DNA-binding transcriptional ArsR family regulator
LREAGLVHTREKGRQRFNSLNVFPIRQIYERWVSPFQEVWSSHLLGIKELAEQESPAAKPSVSRKRNKS